jgi:hypothetical protein
MTNENIYNVFLDKEKAKKEETFNKDEVLLLMKRARNNAVDDALFVLQETEEEIYIEVHNEVASLSI